MKTFIQDTKDSLRKVLEYLEGVGKHDFTFQGASFKVPDKIYISGTTFRDYTCPAGCGGCCKGFDKIFFPWEYEVFSEKYPDKTHLFEVSRITQDKYYMVYHDDGIPSIAKEDTPNRCSFLIQETDDPKMLGRCKIHMKSPFTCRFELSKITRIKDTVYIGKKLFGRGWNMRPLDNEFPRKARCEMVAFNYKSFLYDIVMFEDLLVIAEYLEIDTWLPRIISYLEDQKEKLKPLDGQDLSVNSPFLIGQNRRVK